PALRYLDNVQIWPSIEFVEQGSSSESTTVVANDPTAGSDASSTTTPVDVPESTSLADTTVSLADLGLAIVLVIATVAAVRNLPALIEIILLQRLPLDAGSRYALSTVTRYFIAIVGLTASFNALGIGWSKVQWLAAALTFGLGFGLQEIFANFVSGLIMLAERPIRLGDTVTVGTTNGTVSRIRMRATTITDWDRKELVIPNKTFITGEVINWTLSDPSLRLVIPVGVSYDSDIRLVRERLLEVAARNGKVLKDPAPQALFRTFGDSTLDFELRVFIPNIDSLVEVRHELQTAILLDFRARGIEIAFPQRDLHIRSGLEVLHPAKSSEHDPESEGDDDEAEDHRRKSPPGA
ncbi:MAG: mechanosensitive ion channel, partial [Phycisphaerales bacterium]|nr:mechanosensitive ion channel [Phycisphaerales bacterium]